MSDVTKELTSNKRSESFNGTGRPRISDQKRDENKAINRKNQLKKIFDKKEEYKSMGLDLRRGRYSKKHNDEQKKLFYEKYGIIV